MGDAETVPHVLTKWMNEYRLDFLRENALHYDYRRKHGGRMIFLVRQEAADGSRDACVGSDA